MKKWLEKHPITLICIVVAIMLLPNLDTIGVTIMEARNFITAREMVNDGHWLLTTMNGEPRYQKPPLPTWLTAFSSFIFGIKSIFGLRLPTVIMIMILGSFLYKLSHKILQNSAHSLTNAFIVITSFYVIGITIEAPWDIFTHSFMLIAIYHLFQLFEKKTPNWKNTLIAGLCIGFYFMSKGPVSMYALLIPFLLAYGFAFKYSNLKNKSISFISIGILAIIVGGWWYVYVRLQDPLTFNAITQKETANWSSYNVRPFYYYWSFFTQSGLWTIPALISLIYPYLKNRVTHKKAYTFSFLWTIFTVILLSIIPEKKSRYLMPVLIPLSINIGFYIEYLIRNFKDIKDKKETFPVYFNFGLIALIGILYPAIAYFYLKDNIAGYWLSFIVSSITLFTVGAYIIFYLKKKNMKRVFFFTVVFFASVLITVTPLSKAFISSNYKPISQLNHENQLNVYVLNYVAPEMIWQFGNKLPSLQLENGLLHFPKENEFGILTNAINPEDYKRIGDLYTLTKKSTFDLNFVDSISRKYNKRLLSQYYILKKK